MPFPPITASWLAASATDLSGTTVFLVVGLGLFLAWLLSLLLHPFTACPSCKGTPRLYGMLATRSFRLCSSCGGTGRRLRAGARIWPQNRDRSW
jgi:hypothetical protein